VLPAAPQAAGNSVCSEHLSKVSTPQPSLCGDGGRPGEQEEEERRPRGKERNSERLGGEEDGLWLEAEELSEGEIRSGPDIQLPIPTVKTSLQIIADMYTDDEQ